MDKLASRLAFIFVALSLIACSRHTYIEVGPKPDLQVNLLTYGLPSGFFNPNAETKCGNHIIGYRFVVWLGNQNVAVGFNTSPNCRPLSGAKVHGVARVLLFDVKGALQTSRDIPYDADDGDNILVAQGEAEA